MKDIRYFNEFLKSLVVGVAIYVVFLAIAFIQGKQIVFNGDLAFDLLDTIVFTVVLYMFNTVAFYHYFKKYERL